MTVPVGIATVLLLPDTPHTSRAWFLTEEERALGLERVKKAGKAPPIPITWSKVRRIFTRWSKPILPYCLLEVEDQRLTWMLGWYALVLGYIVSAEAVVYLNQY